MVFESKRQETCALMGEKAEVCGTDCGKTATPVGNNLSIPRFTHHPYCHVAGGILMLRRHVIWEMSASIFSEDWGCFQQGVKLTLSELRKKY